jgi:hypothetical protein
MFATMLAGPRIKAGVVTPTHGLFSAYEGVNFEGVSEALHTYHVF